MRTGTAVLPLHGGKAPGWLFSRMVLLSREVLGHVVAEYGSSEVLRRLSDPYWFQAFGCVLFSASARSHDRAEAPRGTLRPASMRDPARFAFAHGGKDGHPFPVDRQTYDRTIDVLHGALDKARLDRSEKIRTFKRLAAFGGERSKVEGQR